MGPLSNMYNAGSKESCVQVVREVRLKKLLINSSRQPYWHLWLWQRKLTVATRNTVFYALAQISANSSMLRTYCSEMIKLEFLDNTKPVTPGKNRKSVFFAKTSCINTPATNSCGNVSSSRCETIAASLYKWWGRKTIIMLYQKVNAFRDYEQNLVRLVSFNILKIIFILRCLFSSCGNQ